MNETVQFVAQHGYWLLFGAVLGRQACLPIPANLVLLAAGAVARSGRLGLSGIIGLSVVTFLLADLAWYEAGRRLENRVLHFLCGLSRDPGSCVCRATTSFASHGVRTLIISKFVVGLDAVAAPLAGAGRVPPVNFLIFDALGAVLWSGAYAALGYIFSDQLDLVAMHVARAGTFLALVIAAGFGFYVLQVGPHSSILASVKTCADYTRTAERQAQYRRRHSDCGSAEPPQVQHATHGDSWCCSHRPSQT